jgi:hypothetical protein
MGWEDQASTIFDIPFRMLLVRFSSIADGMCTELNKTVVQFPMCPIESAMVRL